MGVTDGDTITVVDAAQTQHKVRLSGIDAPEKGQPFGRASKDLLSRLVFDREVVVTYDKSDQYGRLVGRVLVNGSDANLAQIRAGLAWHYKKYQREQQVDERQDYAKSEGHARKDKVGLWSDVNAVPPWEYRRRKSPPSLVN